MNETYLKLFKLFAFIFGILFFQIDSAQEGVQNINSTLFLVTLYLSFKNMSSYIKNFSEEIPIMLKEHQNGLYKIWLYYLLRILYEVRLINQLKKIM